jgi:hypothetical protein
VVEGNYDLLRMELTELNTFVRQKYFAQRWNRSNEILDLLATQPADPQLRPKSAIPLQIYSQIIGLICYTLIALVFFWLALSFVSIYLVPL